MQDKTIVAQGKYYVYVLKYPEQYTDKNNNDLSGIVFYAGKGSWRTKKSVIQRINEHEAEVRSGYTHTSKTKAIANVWANGKQIIKEIIYWTDTERDALLFEWACINMIYASPNLTNTTGNSYYWEKRKVQQERQMARHIAEWEERERDKHKRTYTVSSESQNILIKLSEEDGISCSECLEKLIRLKLHTGMRPAESREEEK